MSVPQAEGGRPPFGGLLREWRLHRGFSQLELAGEAGISPRHLSFLETGRSSPSRAMIARLSETLALPLRERNHLFLRAGYAPTYSEHAIDDQEMVHVRRAIDLLLKRHDPWPAYAMDGAWNVVASNSSHQRLLSVMLPEMATERANILELVLDPSLLRPYIANWDVCAPVILRRVARQLNVPEPNPELAEVFRKVRRHPDVAALLKPVVSSSQDEIFIPIALRFEGVVIRWMTTVLTFGGAIDVTLEELIVECFFPADDESETIYAAIATRL